MTFGMQKDDNITFVYKVICKKVVSKGWCKERSVQINKIPMEMAKKTKMKSLTNR